VNKTIPILDLRHFPISWDRTQYKYVVIITTLKDELAAKVVLLAEAVSITKKKMNG
jgi:hypothetical protein